MASPAFDFVVKSIKGKEMPLKELIGGPKVTLVVNTASACGFTGQYEGLQKIYDQYKDQGFTVVGMPCNQFGEQEKGSEEEIENFVCSRFKASFPMTSKVDVNGDKAHPLWSWLKSEKRSLGMETIQWNFTKFLLNKDGKVVERYLPTTTPESIAKDVAKLLQQQ